MKLRSTTFAALATGTALLALTACNTDTAESGTESTTAEQPDNRDLVEVTINDHGIGVQESSFGMYDEDYGFCYTMTNLSDQTAGMLFVSVKVLNGGGDIIGSTGITGEEMAPGAVKKDCTSFLDAEFETGDKGDAVDVQVDYGSVILTETDTDLG